MRTIVFSAIVLLASTQAQAQDNTTIVPSSSPPAQLLPAPKPPARLPVLRYIEDPLIRNPEVSAFARSLRLLPPAEFDHPYDGDVIELRASLEWLKLICQKNALACASAHNSKCRIILAPDDVITARGVPVELIRRHEVGHCNGWDGEHKGARSISELKPY